MSYKVRSKPAHTSNYTKGRAGAKIDEIIVHHAASTSFDSIAAVFSRADRDGSAHYGVGQNQNVDKYVDEQNIAWHCGNWGHNKRSVGIENVNSSGAPNWNVADSTFNTLVELCTDIVKRNGIGKLVVGKNLHGHKDVSDRPTACPFALHSKLQELANRVNKAVAGNSAPAKPGNPKKSPTTVAHEVLAGAWGNNPERKQRLQRSGYNYAQIQSIVNKLAGGANKPAPKRYTNEQVAEQVLAGSWGNGVDRKERLQRAGYNYSTIQALVNKLVGYGPKKPKKLSDDQVANQIIAGQGGWGNGADRKARLEKAGYSYSAVQGIVNKKLGF